MSISLVMRAFGAFALSQRRKSSRTAFSAARSAFTVAFAKSIFLALAGRVFGDVASGAPLSWTMADALSIVDAAGAAAGTIGTSPKIKSKATETATALRRFIESSSLASAFRAGRRRLPMWRLKPVQRTRPSTGHDRVRFKCARY